MGKGLWEPDDTHHALPQDILQDAFSEQTSYYTKVSQYITNLRVEFLYQISDVQASGVVSWFWLYITPRK